ncbi:MAG: high mobility group box domain-containing protein [Benjaminiella poitrasii]|nr:MAG: high mobility group box domain-containing protein [Benjaminiella poitrasii]
MTEDLNYYQKLTELKKRIREVEEENDMLNIKLFKTRKSIRHLKLERTFLLDRMEKTTSLSLDYNSDNSEIGSEFYSHDETDIFHKLQGNHKHSKIDKLIVNKPQRKKKDPNAPKGPGNVFFLYCRMEREKIKDEHPTENLGEVTRLLGQKWKSLTKEEKKKYYDIYKRELEEYEEAMKSYNLNPNTTSGLNDISVASSPAQSTEVSMDFTSDLAMQSHESPDIGSLPEEDIAATTIQSSNIYQITPEESSI